MSPIFHAEKGVKNGKFHVNFTPLGRGADVSQEVGTAAEKIVNLPRT